MKAYEARKGMTIIISKTQLSYNMKIEEGFLSMLTGLILFLAETVLPALGVEALSGLASMGIQNLIGSCLYLKKGCSVCKIETDGKGLYNGPTSGKGFETEGNGLYLINKGGLCDGRGLILIPNSPFKNIPILGIDFVRLLAAKKIKQKMEIDEIDGNNGDMYRIKKFMKYREC